MFNLLLLTKKHVFRNLNLRGDKMKETKRFRKNNKVAKPEDNTWEIVFFSACENFSVSKSQHNSLQDILAILGVSQVRFLGRRNYWKLDLLSIKHFYERWKNEWNSQNWRAFFIWNFAILQNENHNHPWICASANNMTYSLILYSFLRIW